MSQHIHGTVVAFYRRGLWRGVLIRGRSGSGKSDMALRLMSMGAQLVVDDQAFVWASGGHAYATAPKTIEGQMELRGIGILPFSSLPVSRLWLVIDASDDEPERMPEQRLTHISGIPIPLLSLKLIHPSTPHLVAAALESL